MLRFHSARSLLLAALLTSACSRTHKEAATGDPKAAASTKDHPNVLLITIDTLRADHLPVYGYRGLRTPILSAIAEQGIVFEHCSAHAPITLPSHTSIMTGLYPPEHGARSNGTSRVDASVRTLAELYKENGYDTAAFVSAFVLDSRFGLNQGFDHYDDDLEDGRQMWSAFGVKDRRAENTVGRVLAWLEQRAAKRKGVPYFTWMHVYDPHFTYDPPEPFRSLTSNPYDGEIAYVDNQLGRLIEGIKQQGLLENTIVVITADHGESLGEHGESTHSLFVYEATQHVPLILRLPKNQHAGKRIPALVRHVDLAPTLVELSGLREREADWLAERAGQSLVEGFSDSGLKDRLVYAEAYLPKEQNGWAALYAVRDANHKYIEAPRSELYDLRADPKELTNLFDAKSHHPLMDALAELRKRPLWKVESESKALDAESQAKLKALGYVSDEPIDPSQAGADPKDMIPLSEAREKAHQLINDHHYDQAIAALQELIEKDPRNGGLRTDLAACYAELNRWAEAETAFQALAKLRPDSYIAHSGLAKVAFKGKRDFALAQKELDLAFSLAPENPSIHGLQGDLLHEQGKWKEAIASYERALAGGDVTPSYLVGYASALHMVGDLQKARDVVERAVRMDNHNPVAHHNHGVILERLGLLAAASGALDEALTLDPRLAPSAVALAKLLVKRGRAAQALGVLERGLKASPGHPGLLGEMGAVLLAADRPAEAVAVLQKATEAAPTDLALRTNLAAALERAGKLDQAYALYEATLSAVQGRPDRCGLMVRLARVRSQQNMDGDARRWLSQALDCGGETTRLNILADRELRKLLASAARP